MDVRGKLVELMKEVKYSVFPNSTDHYTFGVQHSDHIFRQVADHLIAHGVTFAKDNDVPNKWIPVTERLPEDDLPKDSEAKIIKVFVFYRTSMGVPVVRTQIRQKGRRYHRDEWSWAKFEPITHWMPLPQPPKGE